MQEDKFKRGKDEDAPKGKGRKGKDKDKEKCKDDEHHLIGKLKEIYNTANSAYSKKFKRMRMLDAADSGDLWKALCPDFPKYQILPDTNFIAYVKNHLLASIYTVTKGAEVQPTSEKDKEITMHLNVALEQIWNLADVGYHQLLAGERAALLNIGITQVGWDDTIIGGSKDTFTKGNISLKNINPLKFMRDPYAPDLESSSYCITFDSYHKSVILNNPLYKEKFKEYLHKNISHEESAINNFGEKQQGTVNQGYYNIVIFWLKKPDGTIDEIHTVGASYILYKKEDIKPSTFPFAILYCNIPGEDVVGVSECSKAFANNVAYNLMESIALTGEYKNQRPPKFINANSGLNIQSFAKHGDEADRTFIVNNRAQDAVYYHQFPTTSPAVPALKDSLREGIETMTGVDGRYTGRNTGSITTTGGMEEMLNRSTVIDTPKILLYEKYTKRLTQLILSHFIIYSPKRKYFYKNPNETVWRTQEVDFPKIDDDTLFNYKINVSSELPNNKQRIAEMANMLMEKQMQYRQEGASVELITEEEWLMFQDLPNKEYMLERMGIQRLNDAVEQVSQTLFQYADLVKNGMDPNEAILATANTLKQTQMGMPPEQGMIPGVTGMDPNMGAQLDMEGLM